MVETSRGSLQRLAIVPLYQSASSEALPFLIRQARSSLESIREAATHYGDRAAAIIDYLLSYAARPITACSLTIADLDIQSDPPRLTIEKAKCSGGWTHPIVQEQADTWAALSGAEAPSTDPLFPH